MAAETINSAQPHFVPGYTGFCPQFKYRVGDTYGHTTHKLLLDPSVSHSEKLVLSDRTVDDYQVFRPPPRDVDIVDARFRYNDAIYKHPLVPGYEDAKCKIEEVGGKIEKNEPCTGPRKLYVPPPTLYLKQKPPLTPKINIYRKEEGICSSYSGHIPAMYTRFGKNNYCASKNALRHFPPDGISYVTATNLDCKFNQNYLSYYCGHDVDFYRRLGNDHYCSKLIAAKNKTKEEKKMFLTKWYHLYYFND